MDSEQQIKILAHSVSLWNSWRQANKSIQPDLPIAILIGKDLGGVNFRDANLPEADFTNSNLSNADLSNANLIWADFSGADLTGANLSGAKLNHATMYRAQLSFAKLIAADLTDANLTEARLGADFSGGAKLIRANLTEADLVGANLSDADLTDADLSGARLIRTRLNGAIIKGCHIYGASVWDVYLRDAVQENLVVSSNPKLTVDDLEVAHFIYLLLNREKLRNVLESLTSKAVLILGRFTTERKSILEALANELRHKNLLPMVFDFEGCANRDFTETIKILAGLSVFVIIDITNPKAVPQELSFTVPDYQIPFVPILQEGEEPYSMFDDFKKYEWVLNPVMYPSKEVLIANFKSVILDRAWKKHVELRRKKSEKLEVLSIEQMIERTD
jgi:uncharacterized protein YjbI with pentapeptide repeats